MRTGGVEPPQPEALALQAGELASAQRPREGAAGRTRTGAAGITTPMLPLHHGHSGDGRARTGGLSPDKRALWPSELRPREGRAGGIRTHGLELMRLARTTTPLPRCWIWLAGLEPAIPGFQGRWGGQLPHSQKTNDEPSPGIGRRWWAAGSTSSPSHGTGLNLLPRGRPARRRKHRAPSAGLEPAASG